jgi:heavy metal sensor kinase
LKRFSIRVRLAAWYFLSVATLLILFAAGSWFTLRASIYRSIDRDLRYRMAVVVPFLQGHLIHTQEQFKRAFADSSDASIVGVFVEVTDDQSNLVYESELLASHHVPRMEAGPADGSVAVTTEGRHGWMVRVASERVLIGGTGLTIHVVEPLRDMLNSLRDYALYFSLMVPIALLATTSVGYWMSRRALAPVEQIRLQADAIDPTDLTARLRVSETDDELARLAQTLNAMLVRIESGFRAVQQFTADASHELRAPLALIITAAEVSLRRQRSREELAEALGKIVREARHMSKLVEDLLALARGDAHKANAEFTPVDVAGMLRELVFELQPAAAAKGIQLAASLPEGELYASGVGTDLRRLFLILVDNAIKYTESGFVRLELDSDSSQVRVAVLDSGIGIEPSGLPHVFDRFWRADKVRSRAEGGAGLGLSLAAQIVQHNGGTILAESEPGRGSTFTVRLNAATV